MAKLHNVQGWNDSDHFTVVARRGISHLTWFNLMLMFLCFFLMFWIWCDALSEWYRSTCLKAFLRWPMMSKICCLSQINDHGIRQCSKPSATQLDSNDQSLFCIGPSVSRVSLVRPSSRTCDTCLSANVPPSLTTSLRNYLDTWDPYPKKIQKVFEDNTQVKPADRIEYNPMHGYMHVACQIIHPQKSDGHLIKPARNTQRQP